jgi:hypothetical protein
MITLLSTDQDTTSRGGACVWRLEAWREPGVDHRGRAGLIIGIGLMGGIVKTRQKDPAT